MHQTSRVECPHYWVFVMVHDKKTVLRKWWWECNPPHYQEHTNDWTCIRSLYRAHNYFVKIIYQIFNPNIQSSTNIIFYIWKLWSKRMRSIGVDRQEAALGHIVRRRWGTWTVMTGRRMWRSHKVQYCCYYLRSLPLDSFSHAGRPGSG